MQQLSFQLKYGKKVIEQALDQLHRAKQVIKRSLVRNSVVYYLPLIAMFPENQKKPFEVRQMIDNVLVKLAKAQQTLEGADSESDEAIQGSCLINTCQKPERESIDSKLLEMERNIKHVRATQTETDVRKMITTVEADLAKLNNDLSLVRQRPDYLGRAGLREIEVLQAQFEKQ